MCHKNDTLASVCIWNYISSKSHMLVVEFVINISILCIWFLVGDDTYVCCFTVTSCASAKNC